ncbi:MAG: hypothetical protein KatS3mg110_3280 [Pirellulaceae bacterium]|nr:MAG: hypothetical protein KatS3mg110_3280 [Pirellulaceae bacterium]
MMAQFDLGTASRRTQPWKAVPPVGTGCLSCALHLTCQRSGAAGRLRLRSQFLDSLKCILLITTLLVSEGCNLLRSRYAMNDPVYAEQYVEGAQWPDLPGKLKQALDARFADNLNGYVVGMGAQTRLTADILVGAELGAESYISDSFSTRSGIAAYLNPHDYYFAVDAGVRFQPPVRLAPFAGLGTFHGISRWPTLASRSPSDEETTVSFSDSSSSDSQPLHLIHAVYPEIGAHFWIDGKRRITLFGRYLITSEGRSSDQWFIGGNITWFKRW